MKTNSLDPVLAPPHSHFTTPLATFENLDLRQGAYRARFAINEDDYLAALRLRFVVFNLEMKEGLDDSYDTGYDTDHFDPVCHHLIVEHSATSQIVGTYRLQTGARAKSNLGYYSEQEFDFAPYEVQRNCLVELGRACIHRDHRSTEVLTLLWRGIAQYALGQGARYLIGCSSLTSQYPEQGSAVYCLLSDYVVASDLMTEPTPQFAMPLLASQCASAEVPKLLRTYLAIGAKICGPPAIDRQFKTIDFLTLLDLQGLHPRIRGRFLR